MKSSHILLIGLGPLLVCPSVNAAVSGHIQARLVISAACQISNTPTGAPVGVRSWPNSSIRLSDKLWTILHQSSRKFSNGMT